MPETNIKEIIYINILNNFIFLYREVMFQAKFPMYIYDGIKVIKELDSSNHDTERMLFY